MDIDDDDSRVIATVPAEITAAQRAANRRSGLPLLDADGKRIAPRRVWLTSLQQVRREMAVVYRKMDRGEVETSEGTKLVYVLSQIGRVVEAAEFERRLDALERYHGNKL